MEAAMCVHTDSHSLVCMLLKRKTAFASGDNRVTQEVFKGIEKLCYPPADYVKLS
jgi:hypothetical protein